MTKQHKRPGVMIYFDIRPCLGRLSLEEIGLLFESIIDYGEYGVEPDLDGALGMAWDFMRLRVDYDSRRYDEVCEKRRAAAVKRWDNANVFK